MKKFLVLGMVIFLVINPAIAQESKKEAKERHKNYWKKVGTDTRDFWKGEHERKVKKKEEREKADPDEVKQERKGPPKPPNPFRKKAKQETPDKEG